MKVYRTQEEPKFEPITIVLETEDEATMLWNKLNINPDGRAVDTQIMARMQEIRSHRVLNQNMWSSFNNTYRPRGY